MAKLPVISGREAAKAFGKAGFVLAIRRGKGSHQFMVREDPRCVLTIPGHKELAPGMLRALIRQAGLTVEQFVDLL
ncbi:MAG: type II toxin-antitoxin system HicA family toxin [Phycisphaerales bacterium]